MLTNGKDEEIKEITLDDTYKPDEIRELERIITSKSNFVELGIVVSKRQPFGLGNNFLTDPSIYNLKTIQLERIKSDDIKVCGPNSKNGKYGYIPSSFKISRGNNLIGKYKVFVPYAWGNMKSGTLYGGAYADVFIGFPNEICTETFLTHGPFNTYKEAEYQAKYILTRFARACLYINKNSRHSTTVWGAVPRQDFSESWWNESIEQLEERLFDKYEIPSSIRKFILAHIQKKDEESISNFQ